MKKTEDTAKENTKRERPKKKKLVLLPGGIVPIWMPIDEDEIPVFREAKDPDMLSRVLDGSTKPSYIARHRAALLSEAVKKDCAGALPALMPKARRLAPERFDELVSLAAKTGAPECTAWLLQYRRSHYSESDFDAIEQKKFETELGLAEAGLSDYRKVFRISYVPGGIHIGGPKAGKSEYRVPASVKGTPVVSVDSGAFYGVDAFAEISREWPYEETVSGEPSLSDAATGDVIRFGRYMTGKGTEKPIPWRVLARDEGALFVISDTYVATLPYHGESEETTWEKCDLRHWLNEAFMALSFTDDERQMILPAEVKSGGINRFGTDGGNDTRDFIFLPGLDEIKEYMKTDESRCTGSWWWLRNTGCTGEFAACVSPGGRLSPVGNFADSAYGVRPLMRIGL